ncbi:hypothetical protein ACYULU_07335 [Breznakiellaceae bacterium SP9]
MIKKLLFSLAVLSLVAGTSLSADPIGLTVGIDGFGFGDVADDAWKFAGKADADKSAGQGNIAPYVSFEKALDQLTLYAELYYHRTFSDPSASSLDPKVRFTYGVTPELNVWVSDHIVISEYDGEWNYKDDDDESTLTNKAELGLRYTLGLDFGDLYFQAEPGVYTQGKMLAIGALADNEGVKIGVEKVAGGLYGYVQPILQFYASYDGTKQDDVDVLPQLNVRVGYAIGPLDARVTVEIPTGSKKGGAFSTISGGFVSGGNIAMNGLTIQPRVTYQIIEGLSAYADVALGSIAADENEGGSDHVSVSPTIGVSYSF